MFVGDDERIGKQKARMYYHYHSPADIQSIFKDRCVISGFTLKNIASGRKSNKIMIAFGTSRRSAMVSMMRLKRINEGNYASHSSLMYVECELAPKYLWVLDKSVIEIESHIENHFLKAMKIQPNML